MMKIIANDGYLSMISQGADIQIPGNVYWPILVGVREKLDDMGFSNLINVEIEAVDRFIYENRSE